MKIKKNGQQEIVGFVLIVVLVVIALMVFLIIAIRDDSGNDSSVAVSNILDVLMRTTTECAIVYEPDYDSYEDLFKSCYKGKSCSNLDMKACEYLNESLGNVFSSILRSDATISGWNVDFYDGNGEGILRWSGGNCSRFNSGAQRTIVSGGTSLVIRMRVC